MKTNINDHIRAYRSLIGTIAKGDTPPLTLLYGDHYHLLIRAHRSIQARLQAVLSADIELLDLDKSNFDQVTQHILMPALFTRPSLFVVSCRDKRINSLDTLLQKTLEPLPAGTKAIVIWETGKTQAEKRIDNRGGCHVIPCPTLSASDTGPWIQFLCEEYRVSLNHDARRLVQLHLGNDVGLIENEISRLAYLYPKQPIDGPTIEASVDVLREDHAFKLTDLLRQNQTAQASLLVQTLLDRGESPLALIGLLNRHYRNALTAQELTRGGASEPDLARHMRIPQFVARSYADYAQRYPESHFTKALAALTKLDHILKSSPRNPLPLLLSVLA